MPELTIQQALDLAVQHHQAGRSQQAQEIYRQILAQQPDHPGALHLMGVLAAQAGDREAAIGWIRRALGVWPHDVTFHVNLAYILEGAGRIEEAGEAYRRALELTPENADLHFRYGNMLRMRGLMAQAGAQFQEVLRLEPGHVGALNNRGLALAEMGRLDEALACCREAIRLAPDSAMAHSNLGHDLKLAGQMREAIAAYRRATELEPGNAAYFSNLVYALHYTPGYSAEAIFEELRHYDESFVRPLRAAIRPHENDRNPERKLRIGYVTPEFRQHALGLYLMPLLERHDKAQFEIFCYADVAQPDSYTLRHRQCADQWRDTRGMSDEALAEAVRGDRIDILVDLHQHMGGNRLPLLARKPAPVQVGFAGYPNTSGVSAIDYRLTDPYLEPAEEAALPSMEKVLRLPRTWWCYQAATEVPVNELPAGAAGHVTFGNLNNFCKHNEETYQLWAEVMRAVENSRLMLLAPEGMARDRTISYLVGQGIGAERVMFVGLAGLADYLKYYHQIDMGLDSFPYNGHMTSMDSFWMGVPVMSYIGTVPWGRGTWSQASNLGVPELVGRNPEEFVRLSSALAKDLPRLAELRRTLRRRMQDSPLMDAGGYARGIEAVYRQAWKQWCAGGVPSA